MNGILTEIADYLWNQSWQIALLTSVVAAMTWLLRGRSAHLRYLLWLLVLAKCLVPPAFNVAVPVLPAAVQPPTAGPYEPFSAGPVEHARPDLTTAALPDLDRPDEAATLAAGIMAGVSVRQVVVLLWLAGTTLLLTIAMVKAARTRCWLQRRRRKLSDRLQADIDTLLDSFGVQWRPRAWLIEDVGQPFVWGLVRGDIHLPASFAALGDARDRRNILAHELSHVVRFDAAVNLLQVLAQAVFWFHPLVWWANRRIRAEREKSCDETAIARLGAQPRDYSRAIVETLLNEQRTLRPVPSLAVAGPARNIEERIKTMLRPGKRFYRRPSRLAAACALLLALLIVPTTLALTGRPSDAQAKETKTEVKGEQIQAQRLLSAERLKQIGLGLHMYATDHEEKYPEELMALIPYFSRDHADELATFMSNDAEYLAADKTQPQNREWDVPLAYDLTLLRSDEGTNVVFADGHVEFVSGARLDKYGISLPQSHLEVLDVRFEPIHQGKNAVHVTVRNTSDKKQVFATHIYTRSPDYGEGGVGWGTPFFDSVKPQEKKPVRFVFKIQGPVTDRTYVNLRFFNPEGQDRYEYKRYFERHHYTSVELPKAQPDQTARQPASPAQAQAVTQAFNQIQGYIRSRQYEQAWERFSEDFQRAEYQVGFEWFRRAMEPTHPMHSAFTWERDEFLNLRPGQVFAMDGKLVLTTVTDGRTWTIDFVRADNRWQIDWIAGYVPEILNLLEQEEPPPASRAGSNATTPNLRVLDIQFDPIQSGQNAVRLQVQNTSQTDQVFGFDLRTESSVRNWQRQFTRPLKAGQTESMRFEFEITGPLRNASLIRLRFYNPVSPEALDLNDWFEQHRYTGEKFDRDEVSYDRRPAAQQAAPASKVTSHLKVLDVQFEPIQQGKNVLRVQVQNLAGQDQVLGVSVQAHSPGVGGWGTTFLDTVKAGQTQWARCAFTLRGPLMDNSDVELSFYNPGPATGFDAEKWFATKPWDQWFRQRTYTGRELPRRQAASAPLLPAPQDQSQAALAAFRTIQDHMEQGKYEDAWDCFTKDYRDAGFFRKYPSFKECMEQTKGPNRFSWLREEFVKLAPESVAVRDGTLVLTATQEQQKWTIDFVQEDGRWKMDWVAGFVPGWERKVRWEDYVLPRMEKRSTAHFDIYYPKGSTAAREIEQIAQDKDRGFAEICQFLGRDSDVRIRLVLFEDGQSKQEATGHQGAGWAYGNTIVEVYNEKEKLDPYHETAHILMGPFGNPPALFNEGFAVYMSERLGAHALENLGGEQATIHQRARELKDKGEWIKLPELLGYTEIGSARSRPPVAYPEAASFVKFLIDTYGKDKFLQAYRMLKNTSGKSGREENVKKLKDIYGRPLPTLRQQWEAALARS
jgi:prepilin-type processing-associated H-X9-DG protein